MNNNEPINNQDKYLENILKKLNYEQLEQLLFKQAKENLKLKEQLINKEVKW